MQFESLRTALQSIVREICDLHHDDPIPERPWTVIHSIDGASVDTDLESRPFYDLLAARACGDIYNSTALTTLFDTVKDSPDLDALFFPPGNSSAGESLDARRFHLGNAIVCPAIMAYTVRKGGLHYDEETFDGVFRDLLNGLQRSTREAVHVTYLMNANCSGPPVNLEGGWVLRGVTTDELEQVVNHNYPFMFPVESFDLHRVGAALEKRAVHARRTQPRVEPAVIDALIQVLRLATDAPIMEILSTFETIGFLEPSGYRSMPMSRFIPRELAEIAEDDGIRIARLWLGLETGPNKDQIALALRRWSGALERRHPEDALLDYWIGLESLFTPDSTQELSFRASFRLAGFIGENGDERIAIYADAQHSYAWRSITIHGSSPKKQKLRELNKKGTIEDVTTKTRGYLRRALLKILEASDPISLQGIEKAMLSRHQ
ncbi:MAG: hypothetical protein AB7V46_11595 [Thermomicrobiales bacterium]